MFKKIFYLFILLLSLCGCTHVENLEIYNEYHSMITNFNDKLIESGYQNIQYQNCLLQSLM